MLENKFRFLFNFLEYLPALCIGEDIQDFEFLFNTHEGAERIYNFEISNTLYITYQ